LLLNPAACNPPEEPSARVFAARRRRILALLRLAFLAVALAACSFDPSGFPGGGPGGPDGAAGDPDAVPPGVPDAAAPRAPDAMPPSPPDAAPPPPMPGVARAHFLAATAPLITVDGNLSDWGAAEWFHFDAATATHVDDYTGGSYGGVVSVEFAIYYSPTTLYIAFRVDDDTIVDDSTSPYRDDSTEIYLDTNADATGAYESVDHMFTIGISGGCTQYDGGGDPSYNCVTVRSGSDYASEVAVPLVDVNLLPPPSVIGFGAGVNDDDGIPNPGTDPDTYGDAYVPWFWREGPDCGDFCCAGSSLAIDHSEPWCDVGRLGVLYFVP
jgi:hypothetical protein